MWLFRRLRVVLSSATILLVVCVAPRAHAEPWFGWGDRRAEDRYADGDLDVEDLVATRLGGHRVGSGDLHARSWVSLVGFTGVYPHGHSAYGALVVVGLALDKIAAGPTHQIADRPDLPPPPAPEPSRLLLSPALARDAVAAGWRAAGLGVNDARLEAMVARARLSGLLPETRLRALKLLDESGRVDGSSDQTRYYDATGAKLWLEARLTWRLDRLLYADDEPTLERVRLEKSDARTRVAGRVLEVLLQWQRARLEDRPPNEEAALRVLEAEIVLDVLTAGWFTASQMRYILPAPSNPLP